MFIKMLWAEQNFIRNYWDLFIPWAKGEINKGIDHAVIASNFPIFHNTRIVTMNVQQPYFVFDGLFFRFEEIFPTAISKKSKT